MGFILLFKCGLLSFVALKVLKAMLQCPFKAMHAIVCAPLTRWLSNAEGESSKCALLMQPTSKFHYGLLWGLSDGTEVGHKWRQVKCCWCQSAKEAFEFLLCTNVVHSLPGRRAVSQQSGEITCSFYKENMFSGGKKNVSDGLQLLVGWATVSGNACTVHAYFHMRTCANLCTLAA